MRLKSNSKRRLKQDPRLDNSYYDYNESPNCSRHPKLSTLMNDPPNVSTSKENNNE